MVEGSLQFIPSRVEGLAGVTQVTVFPDRIELISAGRVTTHRFVDIARWPRPRVMWRVLYRIGVKPRWAPVADRDWFHDPADMYYEFYTAPRLKVCMPCDETKGSWTSSYFGRIEQLIRQGGFGTNDLG